MLLTIPDGAKQQNKNLHDVLASDCVIHD